jgi:hypothetical protein
MTTASRKTKLQVHYRVLVPGEAATVWIAGTKGGETFPEKRAAWQSLSRIQWFPAGMEGEQLNSALTEELRRSHPMAVEVMVDRVRVLRPEVVLQER